LSGGSLTLTLPPQSLTLLVIADSGAANMPPTAVASASPQTGTAPLAVAFDGRSSADSDGTIAACAWSFGDGAVASGATSSHTYANAGTYTATLTVTDNAGATASKSLTITVNPASVVINAPSNLAISIASRTVTPRW